MVYKICVNVYMHCSREREFTAIFRGSEETVSSHMFKKLCHTKGGKIFEKVVRCKKKNKNKKLLYFRKIMNALH